MVEAIACGTKLERRWSVAHPHVYALIKAGNHLLLGTDGAVTAINTQDGTTAWRGSVDGQARGLAVANGRLFVSTEKGKLYAFAADGNVAPATAQQQPLAQPATTQGLALYVGDSSPEAALKYAQQSPYNVICLLDQASVQPARQKLLGPDYGQRIVVQAKPTDGWLPYADYFANEIVIAGSTKGIDAAELYRVLHPCTGRLTFAEPQAAKIAEFAKQAGIPASEIVATGIARGPLPGAFDWNVKNNVDERIKWPLELLWFGGRVASGRRCPGIAKGCRRRFRRMAGRSSAAMAMLRSSMPTTAPSFGRVEFPSINTSPPMIASFTSASARNNFSAMPKRAV